MFIARELWRFGCEADTVKLGRELYPSAARQILKPAVVLLGGHTDKLPW